MGECRAITGDAKRDFKGYFALFRAYGMKRKEPNVHPVLRRGDGTPAE